ncbi:hypothetical protein Emed_001391 [Eimeria media]
MPYNPEVKVTLCPMLKPLSPWGGVLAFVAARRLARSSTVDPAASSKTPTKVTTEGEEVEKAEVQAQSRRAMRSERRRLQAELRERAQLELAKVRAAKYETFQDPSQLQPGVGHATYSSAKLAEEKKQSQRAAATTTSTKQDLTEKEKTREPPQRPQPVKKPGLGVKLHALFSLIRSSMDSDSSSSSDSSQDEEEPTFPKLLVGPPQTVQRRSCMKVQKPLKEQALTKLTSRVDWSPVVEAARFCKAEPTVICIVRDEDSVLKQPAPLRA